MSHALASPPVFSDVASFDRWDAQQAARWELLDGVPLAMAPERLNHARLKLNLVIALRAGLRARSMDCEAFVDGPGVRGLGLNSFRPDVILRCGPPLPGDAQFVDEPLLLAEVISPSTEQRDMEEKLAAYFALPSMRHYLVVSTRARRVFHFRRADGSALLTTIHLSGPVVLDPPGLSVELDAIYEGTDLPPAAGAAANPD